VSRRNYQLSREVIEFQRAVDPLPDLLNDLRATLKMRASDADLELRRLLRDVDDHATRVAERLAGYRELLTNILQVNATLVGQRQNEEMPGSPRRATTRRAGQAHLVVGGDLLRALVRRLALRHELQADAGAGLDLRLPYALALMALFAGALYWAFKRKGWL